MKIFKFQLFSPKPAISSASTSSFSVGSRERSKSFKLPLGRLLLVIIGLLVLVGAFYLIKTFVGGLVGSSSKSSTNRLQPPRVLATAPINKELTVPIKNEKGEEVSKLVFNIENAQLSDEVIWNGKRANAVKGRVFVFINFRIKNDYTRQIEVRTQDYFRLIVNNNEKEPQAPKFYNEPTIAQPVSVDDNRVGFTINQTDRNIKLRMGELEKEKTTVDLNFK
ncbi:hypothetical protein HYS93_02655 [Candidatus Daviesbacteria bacterium]|nr:hypothetical protein [Candidatus Daviesbacteria bacterium]